MAIDNKEVHKFEFNDLENEFNSKIASIQSNLIAFEKYLEAKGYWFTNNLYFHEDRNYKFVTLCFSLHDDIQHGSNISGLSYSTTVATTYSSVGPKADYYEIVVPLCWFIEPDLLKVKNYVEYFLLSKRSI